MELLFWLLITSIVFVYGGYGILLFPFIRLKRRRCQGKSYGSSGELPAVSLIIAAYNEEDWIHEKIVNSLNLNYPKDKLDIIVVSDGSTDRTTEIVENNHHVHSLFVPERRGKIHAIARAMKFINSEITVFTDANCMLNTDAIMNMVRCFRDPSVGAVAGEKRIRVSERSKSNAHGEGLYWKIESKLKECDHLFYSVVGAAGELFAIRTGLYEPVREDTILDDFVITLNINIKGYRTAYAPEAFAIENASEEPKEEFKRKVRIASGGFQLVWRYFKKISFVSQPRLAFIFYVHRISRWVYAPFALIAIACFNILLALLDHPIYGLLLIFQVLFYLLAYIGHRLRQGYRNYKIILIPYYFAFMHVAVLKGFWVYLKKGHTVNWQRVKREKSALSIKGPVSSKA